MNIIKNIVYFFRSKKQDISFVEKIDDDIIKQTLEKWKSEISNLKPDKSNLIGYVDDMHIRMLELGIDYKEVDKIYDLMFQKIKNL
jgi:hypothetical protein